MFSPKILNTLEKLKEEEGLMIVEGSKDKSALRSLGFENVVSISGKSLEEFVEKIVSIKPSYVTILTDFDEEGENIASRLSNLLSLHKIKVNHTVRNKFKSLKIHKIEELSSFKKIMGDDQNGKISSIHYKIFNRSRIFGRRNSRKTGCYRSDIWPDRRSARPRLGLKRTSKNW
jgi:5S rRNA maturation endonuclease (ribonuclease M5)